MAQTWSSYVNTDFYGQDGSYVENTERIEFKGGRTVDYLKNSVPKKSHTLILRCADKGTEKINGKTEFEHFLSWYENTVKSGTVPFYLTDVISGSGQKLYKISVESWSGLRFKEINITLEEV